MESWKGAQYEPLANAIPQLCKWQFAAGVLLGLALAGYGETPSKGPAAQVETTNDHREADALVYLNRGNAKYESGDMDGAIADATKALQLKPDFALAYQYRAIAEKVNGNSAGVNGRTTNLNSPPAGMKVIPAGAFKMGDSLDGNELLFGQRINGDATPTVSVMVSAFYMDANLVTYSQWQSTYDWAKDHGYGFIHAGSGKAANHPVQMVDWYDTVKWCNARSQRERLVPVYYTDAALKQVYTNGEVDTVYANWTANGYRLPTEAEWEKAARGGLSGQRFPWGNTISESQANYSSSNEEPYDLGPHGYNAAFTTGDKPYTSPVGYFPPNGYGLYDMAGNAAEWVWDWYGQPYAGGSDPRGSTSGNIRILRGGSWGSYAAIPRCSDRWPRRPSLVANDAGFRCVRGH